MPKEAQSLRPWFLDLVPLLVVLLIAAHVFALASPQSSHLTISFSFLIGIMWPAKLIFDSLFDLLQVYWIFKLATQKQPQRRKAH